MKVKLKCEISPGQFSKEYAVTIESHDRMYSLFAEKSLVECDVVPTKDQYSQGWLSVEVIERGREYVLVLLPQSTFGNGRYIAVGIGQVKI